MSKEFDRKMLNFLKEGKLDAKLEEEIRKIVRYTMKETIDIETALKIFGSETSAVDELFQEVMKVFWEKREQILLRNITNLKDYLRKSVRNRILDHLRSGEAKRKLSLDSKMGSEDEETSFVEILAVQDDDDALEQFLAEKMFEHMKEVLKVKSEDLCDFLYKKMFSDESAEIFNSGKSRVARYKSFERIAKKLKRFVDENDLTENELQRLLRLYVSEICEKIRLKK